MVLTTVGACLLQCSPAPPPQPAISSSPSPSVAPKAPGPAFVRPVTVAELGASWRPGCPVGPERLRRVEIDYVGFDGQTHRGQLIVHQDLVADVIAIFEQLHRLRYPIATMRTVDHYPGADDELSMEDNNSSAFNCRPLPSGRGVVSARLRPSHRSEPTSQSLRRPQGRLPAEECRAVPRPQAHRPGDSARRRSRRPRLHRSRLALGRLLAHTEGLSAFRAPIGVTWNAARARHRVRRMTPRCGPGRRSGRRRAPP